MKLVNIDYIPGYEIKEALGLVKGTVVQSKNIGRDLMAGLKTIVGGFSSRSSCLWNSSKDRKNR